jgi:hypothetical protein
MNHDHERRAIRAAMDRLMTGQPLRTTGALTIVGLAHEADVKRHVLTHRHTDLKDEFYARARGQNHVSPQAAIAHQEMDALRRRLTAALRGEPATTRSDPRPCTSTQLGRRGTSRK